MPQPVRIRFDTIARSVSAGYWRAKAEIDTIADLAVVEHAMALLAPLMADAAALFNKRGIAPPAAAYARLGDRAHKLRCTLGLTIVTAARLDGLTAGQRRADRAAAAGPASPWLLPAPDQQLQRLDEHARSERDWEN